MVCLLCEVGIGDDGCLHLQWFTRGIRDRPPFCGVAESVSCVVTVLLGVMCGLVLLMCVCMNIKLLHAYNKQKNKQVSQFMGKETYIFTVLITGLLPILQMIRLRLWPLLDNDGVVAACVQVYPQSHG